MTDPTIATGGSAFPVATTETNEHGINFPFIEPGMTLRDYFAGQALLQFASFVTISKPETMIVVALECFKMADAMLIARKAVGREG